VLRDELATELLVRILRDQKLDARHLSLEDLSAVPPPEASPEIVSMACIVSAFPSEERARGATVADDLRRPSGRHHRVIEEAFALLETLDLAEEALRPVNTT